MPPVLPFDIINLIIDIVGENKDTNLLKELALVSHCFLQICTKHLFATVELHDADPIRHVASSKKGFVKLLKSRPEVVKYICRLTYTINRDHFRFPPHLNFDNDDNLLSPILPNFLRTIPRLNCLKIDASHLNWNSLNSSLTSAFLYLMHLPTVNHIGLSYIHNFPLSSFTSSVNLLRLDISHLSHLNGESPELIIQSEMMPKICEFHTSRSAWLTTKLLHAKMQDGQPAFNFMGLRRLSMTLNWGDDEQNSRYLLQNAKLLEKLHLSVASFRSLVGFLYPSTRNLKVLSLSIPLYSILDLPLIGLCEELEAMAGHNVLESLSCEVRVDHPSDTKDVIGSIIQNMEKVLVKPGWSSLRQVSLEVSCRAMTESVYSAKALQSLPDEYLSHLSKLEFVAFNYSVSRRS
jgi:hypothetical protein